MGVVLGAAAAAASASCSRNLSHTQDFQLRHPMHYGVSQIIQEKNGKNTHPEVVVFPGELAGLRYESPLISEGVL
jgi:hypothetical protein